MGDYTKLKIDDVNEILKNYDNIGQAVEMRALSLGISNSNYEIQTKDQRYLLKVSNDKNIAEVKSEMEILKFLKENDYEYSITPFYTLNNEAVYSYKDYHGVIFPFIEGIPPGPSDDTCFEIGHALAKLHCIEGDHSKLRHSFEISFPPKYIKDFIQNKECPLDFKTMYMALIDESYFDHNFSEGIIHGDLYYDNTMFDNNHIKAVLDFEQSGVGELIFDLGVSISGCCLEKGRISLSLIDSYLKGYEEIRPLKDLEKKYLHQSIIWGLFSIALWRIKRFTLGNLNPLMADSYKELLARAEIFKEQINE